MKTNHKPNCSICERINDVLMVSSFALWAMALGFTPVLTWRLLVS
jgi:hypothetical protein